MNNRCSGILLHITSLSSSFGVGDLGPSAYEFADFLSLARQSIWQVLPITPVDPINGNSPYSSISVYAGNTLLISPEILVRDGFLIQDDMSGLSENSHARCDYHKAATYKEPLFELAYRNYKNKLIDKAMYDEFCSINSYWLEDFALFLLLKRKFNGASWNTWLPELRDRNKDSLFSLINENADQLDFIKFKQWLFFKQWYALKTYCNEKGLGIFGDLPIYVSYDSADVWANHHLFKLDDSKNPVYVAGVPPDYFSKTGQRWGNPVYQWDVMKQNGYQWWLDRIGHYKQLFDLIRIDHFRGFVSYWEIPAYENTAVNGSWMPVPAEDFFTKILDMYSDIAIIAEDLGTITDDVRSVMNQFGFQGMRILLFAFGEDNPLHPYLPHNYIKDCVVYTGTHDNNTARGWFEREAGKKDRDRLLQYLGRKSTAKTISSDLIRTAMMSVANTVIIPMQDLLGLGQGARMNIPGTSNGNWEWRLLPDQMTSETTDYLRKMTLTYGRESRDKKK